MAQEFTAAGAWTLLAAVSAAGFFGLRMCRAMLLSPTASDLRREAAIEMMKRESFSSLSSHQQAAVFLALSASGTPRERSTPQGRFRGSQTPPIQRMSAPLDTSINRPQKEKKHGIHQDS